jgi:hypothetical protein
MERLLVGVIWCKSDVITPLHSEIKRCKGVISVGITPLHQILTPPKYTLISCQGKEKS